jgi:hypothetical protein
LNQRHQVQGKVAKLKRFEQLAVVRRQRPGNADAAPRR